MSADPPECKVTVSFAVLRAISFPAAVFCISSSKFARVCNQDAVKFKWEHKRLQPRSVFEVKSTTVEHAEDDLSWLSQFYCALQTAWLQQAVWFEISGFKPDWRHVFIHGFLFIFKPAVCALHVSLNKVCLLFTEQIANA